MPIDSKAQTLSGPIQRGRTIGGKVFVEKPNILEDVIIPGIESHPRRVKTERLPSPKSLSSSTRRGRSTSPGVEEEFSKTKPLDFSKFRKEESIATTAAQAARDRRDRMFPVLLERVDEASKFLDSVEKEMILATEAKNNKIRRQYEDWNTNVHGKIQKKIAEQIDSVDSKTLNKKKNEDYGKFLNITNRKAAIFRDIIIESEYDPLEPNRKCVKAKTGKIYDPVKISAMKEEAEASMLEDKTAKKNKKKPQLGKETLAVELWASGQIEATPYGTFERMMNNANKYGSGDSQKQAKNATLRSHITFDHFNYPKGREAIDAEMPKGKRIHPEQVYSDPGRIFGSLSPEAIAEIRSIKPPPKRTISNIF